MLGKMKLFIFCSSLSGGKGGAERIATNLVSEMINRGHDVYVGYNGYKDPAYTQDSKAILTPWNRKKSIEHYQKKVIELNPDCCFVLYFGRSLMEHRKMFSISGIPFGMQECTNPKRLCYNNWINKTDRKGLPVWEREMIASSAARIRMVMPGYEKSFPPYIRQNVRAFPNSVPSVQHRAKPSGQNTAIKKIIIIGGLKKHKNLTLLIKSFSRLSTDYPEWEIHDYGIKFDEKNQYHHEISELLIKYGIKNNIIFHGPVDDIFPEYAGSHIHAITSLSEGCPTAVLEAMAHGLPSIGISSCPGTNDLIHHNKNGILVDYDKDGEGLAKGLHTLMSSPSLRDDMGDQAHIDSKLYRNKEVYDQWENLFREMISYKHSPDKLLHEQKAIDYERAMHMVRCRQKYLRMD